MAIDYGDARTGIAVSDESATLTGDVWVIHSKKLSDVTHAIAQAVKERGVSCIVVGYPKNMDGTIGPRAEKSERLVRTLRSLIENTEIKLWDERLTTLSANRVLSDVGKFGKKRKNTVDAVAASLILESYIGSLK